MLTACGAVRSHCEATHPGVINLTAINTLNGALSELESGRIGMVILDTELPDCSGVEAVARIKSASPDAMVLAIIDQNQEIAKECIEQGALGCVTPREIGRFLPLAVKICFDNYSLRRELATTHHNLEILLDEAQDAILVVGDEDTIIYANSAAQNLFMLQAELVGQPFGTPATVEEAAELDVPLPHGQIRTVEMRSSQTEWRSKPAKLVILRDITDRKIAETEMRRSHDELESRVKARTEELEEANTALKVLLKRREEDKRNTEETVICNARELIQPYLDKLRNTRLDEKQRVLLEILETNTKEIFSPFVRNLFWNFSSLTPMEVQITTLIEEGKTAKQIAGLLNISIHTVKFHKANLRKKFGLRNKDVNLCSFLKTIKTK